MQTQLNQNNFQEQPINVGALKPEGNAIQRFHYEYNPEKGTQLKWGNSLMTVTGATAAGAAGVNYLASSLGRLGDENGSILERGISSIATNPLIAGAIAGGACGILLVHSIRGDGLKPRTEDGIRFVMNGLIHKAEKGTQNIEQYKKSIDINKALLSQKKPLMLQEKEANEKIENARYATAMQLYQHKAGLVAGELKGYLDGLFEKLNDPERCPTYEETVSGRRVGGTFQLGLIVSGFFHNRDYSWSAQNGLKQALIPALTENELKKVDAICARFPLKPIFRTEKGPFEKEYNQLQCVKKSTERELVVAQNGLSSILQRYPLLRPDAEHQVIHPPLDKFRDYLPD